MKTTNLFNLFFTLFLCIGAVQAATVYTECTLNDSTTKKLHLPTPTRVALFLNRTEAVGIGENLCIYGSAPSKYKFIHHDNLMVLFKPTDNKIEDRDKDWLINAVLNLDKDVYGVAFQVNEMGETLLVDKRAFGSNGEEINYSTSTSQCTSKTWDKEPPQKDIKTYLQRIKQINQQDWGDEKQSSDKCSMM